MTTIAEEIAELKPIAEKIRRSLVNLQSERDARQAEVDEMNQQIAQLELVLISLAPLVDDIRLELEDTLFVEGICGLALTEACREVLRKSSTYRTARGIRDSLEASGYDLKGQHNNPLASIHGVLKRLAESGEAEELQTQSGTRYRWKGQTGFATATGRFHLRTQTSQGEVGVNPTGPPTREEFQADLARQKKANIKFEVPEVPGSDLITRKKKKD